MRTSKSHDVIFALYGFKGNKEHDRLALTKEQVKILLAKLAAADRALQEVNFLLDGYPNGQLLSLRQQAKQIRCVETAIEEYWSS